MISKPSKIIGMETHILEGRAHKLGDDINTDLVISGRYKFSIQDMAELSAHIFEDIDPDFAKKIKRGASFIVAGENFGMGSSREQAPLVIKEAGINAVIAKSFARIFYRNGFNVGLPLVEADTDKIEDADMLALDLKMGELINKTKGAAINTKQIPDFMMKLIEAGGVVNYIKKYKEFRF